MTELMQAIVEASGPGGVKAVGAIYDAVQREIDARRPLCVMSGRCCRFEEYGHRLYVTTLELASFLAAAAPGGLLMRIDHRDRQGCPFQLNGLCSVHAFRPFGCRIFFCDPTATQWQQDLYERYHAELKRLHETLGVRYFYVEWREGLAALAELTKLAPHNPVGPTDNL